MMELIDALEALADQVQDVEALLCPSYYSRSNAEHAIARRLMDSLALVKECQGILRHPSVIGRADV